jgi:hypothetical protein
MSGQIQSSMQSVQVPVMKLRGSVVSALFRESHFIILFPGFMWSQKSKFFYEAYAGFFIFHIIIF